jgi:hypothetical protein
LSPSAKSVASVGAREESGVQEASEVREESAPRESGVQEASEVREVNVLRESEVREASEVHEVNVLRENVHPVHLARWVNDRHDRLVARKPRQVQRRRSESLLLQVRSVEPKRLRRQHVHHVAGKRSRPQLQRRRNRLRAARPKRLRHPHLKPVLLRASRGDSKPCYWHRHVLNIANSIAAV